MIKKIAIIFLDIKKYNTLKNKYSRKYNVFKNTFKNIKDVKIYNYNWNDKNLIKKLKKINPNGIILSGSKCNLFGKCSTLPKKIYKLKIPILGLCQGFHRLIYDFSNENKKYFGNFSKNKIYTKTFTIKTPFKYPKHKFYIEHKTYIKKLPKGWKKLISTKKIIYMAYNKKQKIIGIQFHPEMLKNTRSFFINWLEFI
jgi:GMP synthase (glutamine-hydrolysing)